MAELTIFGFRPKPSFLSTLDARFKLASFVMIGLTGLNAQPFALALLSCFLGTLYICSRFSETNFLKNLRHVLIFMACIILTRGLFTPGDAIIKNGWFSISRQGVYDGFIISWRLMLIVVSSLLFIITTRSSEIKTAVQWFLKPVPGIPERRVAVMISLIIRFIPMILSQAKETAAAQKARCVENRKNPLYRFPRFMLPLIRRTFETADKLATAMEARCYSETRTDPPLSARRTDWLSLSMVLAVCLVAVFV